MVVSTISNKYMYKSNEYLVYILNVYIFVIKAVIIGVL